MKKTVFLSVLAVFCCSITYAQSNTENGSARIILGPKIFAGASAIIGVTTPGFSYGLGGRMNY